jgi:predicted membrane-bound mannosyltransferase
MKEYKVESSWAKLHIVVPFEITFGGYLMPIYCTKRGDIVGDDDYGALVKFNVKGEVQVNFSYCSIK